MKNMVWKYCRSISPEWKQQVWKAKRQAWAGQGAVAPPEECQPGEHFTLNLPRDLRWIPAPLGRTHETEAGVGCGWKVGLTGANSTGQ